MGLKQLRNNVMSSADLKLRSHQTGGSQAVAVPRPHFADRANSSSDADLIRQAQAGRWEAFAELASHYDSSILALTLRLGRSEREARDLFQAALVNAYQELRSYHFQCSFYLWIYRIVAATCLQFLEQRRGEAGLHNDNGNGKPFNIALHQLSPRERMVLELKHSFGLKLETIAAILQTSPVCVRNTFTRAILLLRLECNNAESC